MKYSAPFELLYDNLMQVISEGSNPPPSDPKSRSASNAAGLLASSKAKSTSADGKEQVINTLYCNAGKLSEYYVKAKSDTKVQVSSSPTQKDRETLFHSSE